MTRRTGALALPLAAGVLMASALVLAAPAVAAQRPVDPGAAATTDVDPSDRESMRQGYLDVLAPAMATPIGWTGNLASCDAGAPSAEAQQATLTAVNYFRDLVGVEPVVFDSGLSAKAQQAALVMARNGDLSHDPPTSWACWTQTGHDAAGSSNLSLGVTGASAIAGYMDDGGAGNYVAGHRRWIIDPRETTMGSGSIEAGSDWRSTSNALYVLDTKSWQTVPASTPEFMPWPAAGYVPIQIEPEGRWSLSAGRGAGFGGSTVTVNGSAAGITVHAVEEGYGPSTLVWDFDPGFEPGDADRTYHVVVSDIQVGDVVIDYSYDVTLFDAESAPGDDLEPPVVTSLRDAFAVRFGNADFAWQAADPSGVEGSQLRWHSRTPGSGFDAWREADWQAGSSPTWGLPLRQRGVTWCVAARARDTAGNVSPWSEQCVHTPVDDATLAASPGWRTVDDPSLWKGSAHTSRKAGARLTLPSVVDADRIGVVGTTCPSCGTVGLYVGGAKVGTISLRSAQLEHRQVLLLPRLAAPLDGRVAVVVESARKTVQVDGLVVAATSTD